MNIEIEWKEKRNGTFVGWIDEDDCDCLIEALMYEIIKKRSGKFFVKAFQWQSEIRMPFRDFDTKDDAMGFCTQYETERQEKARDEEKEEIYI